MMSPTGNKSFLRFLFLSFSHSGFTFVEIMTTLAILSIGIVMIFKSFFMCMNTFNHVMHRVVALQLVEHKVAEVEQMMREQKDLKEEEGSHLVEENINNTPFTFQYNLVIKPVEGTNGLYELDMTLFWKEGARDITYARAAYVSDRVSLPGAS